MSALGKRLLGLGVLVVLCAGAGLYAYLVEHRGGEERAQQAALDQRLFRAFTPADVRGLALNARAVVELEQVQPPGGEEPDGVWRITAPRAVNADAGAASAIVRALQNLQRTDVVEEHPQDLAKYGLAERAQEVTVKFADGAETVLVGREFRFGNARYAKRADREQVVLVPSSLFASLDKDLFDLRDKAVLPIPGDKVSGLTVMLQAPAKNLGYTLSRGDAGWQLAAPRQLRADQARVGTILSTLESARAWSFAAEEPSPADLAGFGLDHPAAVVQLRTAAGETTVRVGVHGDKHYARVDGQAPVAEVGSGVLQALDLPLFDLRDKRSLVFDRDRVAGVKIEHHDGTTVVLKKSKATPEGTERWELLLPEPGPAQDEQVSTLLWHLGDLKADRFVDEEAGAPALAASGLDPPRITVTLLDAADAELGALLVGKREDTQTHVLARGFARIDAVPNDQLDALPLQAKDLRAPTPPGAGTDPADFGGDKGD